MENKINFKMFLELEQGSTIYIQHRNNSTFTSVTFILSTIGIVFSIFCLLLLLITAFALQEWRQNYKNQLLIQLMLARSLYTLTRYFFDVRTIFNFCGGHTCIMYMDEIMMIYSEVLLVTWMIKFSIDMYRSLVTVLNPKYPIMWKTTVATWGIPLVITLIIHTIYTAQTGKDLMIYFLYLAMLKWPVLVANAVILIMILKSLTKKPQHVRNNQGYNNSRIVVVINILIFSFCFQQVFVDIYKLVFILFHFPIYLLYIINLCTTYHCAAAIVFWVFGNANTRYLWRSKILCRGKVPLSPTTSLSTNCTSINSLANINK